MSNRISRRDLLTFIASGVAVAWMPMPAVAFSVGQAESLITKVVSDINRIINSGNSESTMLRDFEQIFVRYADVGRIAQIVLGADGRSASAAQKTAFAKAFQGYISRKYGKRFREFIGGQIEVKDGKAVKSFFEVQTTAILQGEAPFDVVFVVAGKTGKFIDMKIEGISLVKAERTEIGAMLDRRKGNLDQLIKDIGSAS